MLSRLAVANYKCLDTVDVQLAPLTLLAGPNASGKSTLIQAILLACSAFEQKNGIYLKEIVKSFSQFEDVVSRTTGQHQVSFSITTAAQEFIVELSRDGLQALGERVQLPHGYEENLFYLAANRIGPEELAELNRDLRIGEGGQYALGYFEQGKDKPVHHDLRVSEAPSTTLKAQIAWWLGFITGVEVEALTQKITSTSVKMAFRMGELGEVSPYNTGAGNSFLLKLCIMCLAAKPGDVLLIENPEIHLHPGAQSRLGVLLAHLSAHGVQLIVETHCEHLLNRVRYEVYQKRLAPDQVIIHYKPDYAQPFETLGINPRGHYCDEQGGERPFPAGFFDSTLAELLEIG